jgi:hypothetical protein
MTSDVPCGLYNVGTSNCHSSLLWLWTFVSTGVEKHVYNFLSVHIEIS